MCPLWMLQRQAWLNDPVLTPSHQPVTDLPLTGCERLEEPLPFREFCPTAALQASAACEVKEEIDSIIQC